MKILDLSRKQLAFVGLVVTMIGVTVEGAAFVAFAGGLIVAWALKPPVKVYAVVEYEDKKILKVKKLIPAEEIQEK